MTLDFPALSLYLLVFTRFVGMLGFNPLLSRKNVPPQVRTILCFTLTILVAPTLTAQSNIVFFAGVDYVVTIAMELLVGFACGFVFTIFYDMLLFAGDLLDTEFGMSMAKIFDPGSNMQMSATGKFLSFIFVAYFFLTGSHLVMIYIFSSTFDIIAPGAVVVSSELTQFILDVFVSAFSLVMRLAIPFMSAELVLQVALGLIMKLVPQIHVFVINFQLKQGVGLILLLLLAPVISSFIDNYLVIMQESIQNVIYTLA